MLTDADPCRRKSSPMSRLARGSWPARLYRCLPLEVWTHTTGQTRTTTPSPCTRRPVIKINVSANIAKMKGCEDAHVKVFHGLKTFEYDLALEASNPAAMLEALAELHRGSRI